MNWHASSDGDYSQINNNYVRETKVEGTQASGWIINAWASHIDMQIKPSQSSKLSQLKITHSTRLKLFWWINIWYVVYMRTQFLLLKLYKQRVCCVVNQPSSYKKSFRTFRKVVISLEGMRTIIISQKVRSIIQPTISLITNTSRRY